MHRIDALVLGDKPSPEVDNRGYLTKPFNRYFTFMSNMIDILEYPPSLTEFNFGGGYYSMLHGFRC